MPCGRSTKRRHSGSACTPRSPIEPCPSCSMPSVMLAGKITVRDAYFDEIVGMLLDGVIDVGFVLPALTTAPGTCTSPQIRCCCVPHEDALAKAWS